MAVGLNVEESASTPLLPPKPKPKRMKTILTFGLLFGAIFVLMILSYWKTSTDLDDYFGITQYHFESMKKKEKEDTTKLRSVQSNMVNQLQKKSEEEEKKKEKLEKYRKAADDYKRCKFKNIRQAALAYDLSYVTLYKVCYSYPWPFQKTNIT